MVDRVVAVGGGHGLARALEALRRLDVEPMAVVTVADDGGSSGRLRRELGIIAPGDLRMALDALARNRPLADLFQHRFGAGELEGHALGNLALVALAERTGGFVEALDEAGRLLDLAGRVLPATVAPVELRARSNGRDVDGQVRVATTEGPVERLWLEPPDAPAPRQAVVAIRDAGLVVLGPGSLFTSVIAGLLVPELSAALAECAGTVVHVANIRTQPGETSGLDLDGHLDALFRHLPGLRLDAVVVHDGPAGRGPGQPLAAEVTDPRAGKLLRADVLARDPDGTPGWGHDPVRLAAALEPLLP